MNAIFRALAVLCLAGLCCAALFQESTAQGAARQRQGQQPSASGQQPLSGPDDRPYDAQLLRLAEILGALHYLRAVCGANEGQTWRQQMHELVLAEGTSALRRARLVESFNRGYRGYSSTYRSCTPTAQTAIEHFMEQAAALSDAILASEK